MFSEERWTVTADAGNTIGLDPTDLYIKTACGKWKCEKFGKTI